MRSIVLAAVVTMVAGCAELPAVEPGRCGNHVLEPEAGEECDGIVGCGGADTANQCLLVCEDGAACPDGWQCGVDQRCRAPTETFVLSTVVPMGPLDVTAADMDGDLVTDLTGRDALGMIIRYGDADGALAAQTRVPLPAVGARPLVLDADRAGGLDLALPLGANGLALFVGDGARGMFPAAQITADLPDDGMGCPALHATGLHSSLADPKVLVEIGGFGVVFADNQEACMVDPDGDCIISLTGGALLGDTMPVAALGYDSSDGVVEGDQFAAAVVGSTAVSVWGEHLTAPRPERINTWTMSAPLQANGHLWFAKIDADVCPDLVIDTGTEIAVVYNAFTGNDCKGLGDTPVVYARPIGDLLGIGDIDNDGQDELLHTLATGPALPGTTIWARELDLAGTAMVSKEIGLEIPGYPTSTTVVDYNGDGWGDVVIDVAGQTTLDFYLNYLGTTFNRFPVDLGGYAVIVEAGDYDGDLRGDVAVTVADPINPDGDNTLFLFYGGSDARPTPQFLGQFMPQARPVRFPGGLQPATDSILVVSNQAPDADTPCGRRLSVLIGDTSRQMVSLYILLEGGGAVDSGLILPLVLADVSSPGDSAMLVLGALEPDDGPDATSISVLGFDGTAFEIDAQFEVPITELDPGTLTDRVRMIAGQLDDDIAQVPEAILVSSTHAGVVSITDEELDWVIVPDALASPMWMELIDMDGDGDLDAVGASGNQLPGELPTEAALGPASRLWIAWNEGGALDFAAATVLAVPGSRYCVDADAVFSRAEAVPELVALCYRIDAGGGIVEPTVWFGTWSGERDATELTDLRGIASEAWGLGLEVDDFTGDGLDDVAVFGATTAGLYRQCGADDRAACEAPE